ncbi:MAG: tetratricopeptide repeat protein [Pyrinomonadaceae bacterium]
MRGKSGIVSGLCVVVVAAAFSNGSHRVPVQDLVATEEITSGSSCFVFRESRKKPQSKLLGGRVAMSAGRKRSAISRSNAQVAALAKQRQLAAIAVRKKTATAAANRKLALSNTLTAKAEGFLDNNQTDLAITNYRAALVQNAKNTRASDGLSNALTAKGIDSAGDTNNLAAVVYFDEAVKLDKQNDVAYAKLGAIYDANGQADKGVANYEKALAINPQYSMLYTPLGLAYLDAGEVAKAESSLQKAAAASVDTVETRYLRGLIALKQNKNDEALTAFDSTLQLDGSFAMAQYQRGQVLDRLGRQDQAIAAYQQTLTLEPTFGPAAFDMGVNYYNNGEYDNAAAAYQTVIQNDPANAQAHLNLASTFRQLERFADANGEYKLAAVEIKTPDLYSEWGYCLGKTAEWDKSVARLATAAEISPTAIDTSNLGWAHYNTATTQLAGKDEANANANFAKAKVIFEKAVAQDPKLDAAYLNLGSTHNALGEFQQAVQMLTTALNLRSNWSIAINQLGLGYRGLRDFKNAIATFKRVVDSDGRNTFGLYNLGETYFASGNKNEAKKINDKLKKIDSALASRLDNVIAGKVVDAAKDKIQKKVPIKIPKFP